MNDTQKVLTKAYTLFLEELSMHLSQIPSSWGILSREQCYSEMTRFHTLRGGAGFFGLSELSDLAGRIETRLKTETVEGDPPVEEMVAEFRGIVTEVLEEKAR